MTTTGTVLGLDLGPNSIGWALLSAEFENGEQINETGLIAAGVRVFEEGVDNFDSSKEASRAQARRMARSARRRQRRKRERRDRLRALLQKHGLLPDDSHALLEVMALDPYPLRAKGLNERLTLPEIGRVLYHLNQRRGFKSNRKQERGDKESGVVQEAITALKAKIAEAGSRTLGEFLHRIAQEKAADGSLKLNMGELRLRDRYTERAMYEHEFDTIWEAQSKHHATVLTPELRRQLRDEVIFFQRPFEVTEERLATMPKRANAWRSPTVRRCPFSGERVLARGHWLAQQFRIWKEVNNLSVFSVDYGGRRELTTDERRCIAVALQENRERKFDDLRKLLNTLHAKLKDDSRAPGIAPDQERFNLEEGGRTKLNGNTVEHALIAAISKKKWPKLSDDERAKLRMGFSELVLDEDDPEKFNARMRELFKPYDLTEEALAKLAKFHLPEGYMAYSRKAVEQILPRMEQGEVEYYAIKNAGLRGKETATRDKLLAQDLHDLDLPNPVVKRALFELRKVVNAIAREYGRPERIIVEMAREMHGGKDARSERSKRMNERGKQHDRIAAEVEKLGKPPTMSNIKKYLLWEEQGGTCPYTGNKIGVSQIFSGEIQIDHIIPRYRSLDDSLMNRVLSFADANRAKGDRSPFEWVGGTAEHTRMLECVKRMPKMPGPKKARFAQEKVDADEFVARQLNDTSYIAREAVAYLELLYPPEERVGQKRVGTTRGNLTAELRRQWSLNRILSTVVDGKGQPLKSREDHRHHAIDAVVVALSSRRHLKAYQNYWKRRDVRSNESDKDRPQFDTPWGTPEEFRGSIAGIIDGINVSHRVQGKIRGAFHEATYYGRTADKGQYVFRVPLTDETSPNDIDNIRDVKVKHAVVSHLVRLGWKEGSKVPKGAFNDPPRLPSGVAIRRVRVTRSMNDPLGFVANGSDDAFRYAQLGNNHHIEFVEVPAAKGGTALLCRVVPMLEVARNVRSRRLPMAGNDLREGTKLIQSLTRKDSVLARDPETGRDVLCVVQVMSGSADLSGKIDLYLRDARDSRRASDGNKSPFKRFKSIRAWLDYDVRRVRVDPLGRIQAE